VGGVRVTPLMAPSSSFLGRLVGPAPFQQSLDAMGLHRNECVEAGRWIVSPSARGGRLGRMLLISLWVVGRFVGARCLFGAVGVRDGQVKMLARCGGQTAPCLTPVSVEEYDDELSVMYFDLLHPPPDVAAQLPTMERLLNISGAGHGTVQLALSGVSM
jgi:hypothetical protein